MRRGGKRAFQATKQHAQSHNAEKNRVSLRSERTACGWIAESKSRSGDETGQIGME